MRRLLETDRLQANGPDGQTYTVLGYQEVDETPMGKGYVRKMRLGKAFKLSTGAQVDRIDNNTFQIVDTDEIIRKI